MATYVRLSLSMYHSSDPNVGMFVKEKSKLGFHKMYRILQIMVKIGQK
jgi:hypothetical protein